MNRPSRMDMRSRVNTTSPAMSSRVLSTSPVSAMQRMNVHTSRLHNTPSTSQSRLAQQSISSRSLSSAAAAAPIQGIGNLGKFLEGRAAVVTGSTSGIGLGVAKTLAAHGCNVTINGFGDLQEINRIQDEIRKDYGVKVMYSPADMTKPEQIRDMISNSYKEFGRLDILVNNAGIQHISSVKDFPEEKWDQVIAINLSAVFHATKAALPIMEKNNFGRIVNISSVHGLVASVNKSAYVASKHAVVGFTKAVALEHAGKGITANCVNPGWVLTDLVKKQIELRAQQNGTTFDEARSSLLLEKQPSGNFVTTEDLGNLISFLSSSYANQVTGTNFVMDGGWTAQ